MSSIISPLHSISVALSPETIYLITASQGSFPGSNQGGRRQTRVSGVPYPRPSLLLNRRSCHSGWLLVRTKNLGTSSDDKSDDIWRRSTQRLKDMTHCGAPSIGRPIARRRSHVIGC